MKKIKLTALILAVLTMISFGTIANAQQTEVTLTARTHDQLYIDYFNSRTAEFDAAHPDLKITYDFQVDSQVGQNVLNQLAAGEQIPDLVGIERGQFGSFMKDGAIDQFFVNLTPLIGDRAADYSPGRWSIYSYQGQIYGVESSLTPSVLYYQPAVFEAAGVEVPTTWEQVLNDVGPKLAANGNAFTFATNDGTWFQMYYNQRGGNIFDADGNFVMGDETNKPIAIEVATYIQQAVQAGIFLPVLGGDVWSGATIPTAYQDGALAATVMPDWWSSCCLKPGVPDMEGKWSMAPMPAWEGGGFATATWGGTGWAVGKGPNQDLAWEFLDFVYLGKDSQVKRFEQINMFPVMFEAMSDPVVTAVTDPFYGDAKVGQIYADAGQDMVVWYNSQFFGAYNTAAGTDLPALFDGTMTPEDFVNDVIAQTQNAIDFGS
ncbi:MAG: extracellular solute-binding protein [Chloroflexi bacterium]|nr:extracellular solute-binding protein [Chloroflexota bacterium]MCC6891973.1 extracellular solute-binding protein [Anaerolineae bacterium]